MSNYVIGIGGTGARCIEGIIHLCAAGMLPSNEQLHLYFVDADKTNGNLVKAKETLLKYINFRDNLKKSGSTLGKATLFQTEIKDHDVWSPFDNYQASQTLEDIFSYASMNPDNQDLFELLYTNKKRKMRFENGFLGWPSVGCSVIAKEYDSFNELINKISNDVSANVILVGSIFGGTGAAGIPTLAKLIKQSFVGGNENIDNKESIGVSKKLALILLLPYFSFNKLNDEEDPNADSSNFKLKSKLALEYYHNQKLHDICDSIFILSDNYTPLTSDETVKGGENQKNNPHFIELYAALFATDFFNNANLPANIQKKYDKKNKEKYFETCRSFRNTLEWKDLPYFGDDEKRVSKLINTLGRFTSFSFVYSNKFHSIIEKCSSMSKIMAALSAPWYPRFFPQHPEDKTFFENLNEYCNQYLKWITEIQRSAEGQVKINLIRDNFILPTADTNGLGNLIHGVNNRFSSIRDLEHEFTKLRKNDFDDATGNIGKFVRALYQFSLDNN